jgi:hypothetical protein
MTGRAGDILHQAKRGEIPVNHPDVRRAIATRANELLRQYQQGNAGRKAAREAADYKFRRLPGSYETGKRR